MASWSERDYGGSFHTDAEDVLDLDDERVEAITTTVGDPIFLPAGRRQVLEGTHRHLRRAWVSGGAFFQLYSLETDPDDDAVVPETVVSLFWDLADADDLPADIAGCSIAWLAEGRLWPETVQQFGDALYKGLHEGGVAGEGLSREEAVEQVNDYLEALFGETPESELHLFGLDPGFSCWFCDGEYDIAYAIINTRDNWFGLFMATDSE